MFNRYILKSLSIAAVFGTMTADIQAQETKPDADSNAIVQVEAVKTEAARLFTIPKKYSTAAVSAVSGDALYGTPAANFTNTLYGRLAGLTVAQGSGEPGADEALLGIRGIGTYGFLAGAGGYHTYKIFVDGFETNRNYFRNLSAAEIESVSILKDGAALATFGMRGANGVIWVTTKRGKPGKPVVQVQARTGFQNAIQVAKPLRSYEYASLYNQAISNDNGNTWSPRYTDAQLQDYQNGKGVDVGWYDQVLRDHVPYTDADLLFSGGDHSARYSVVLNYVNQNGLYDVRRSDTASNLVFRRYNIRTNLDFKLFSIFEARVDLSGRIGERKQPNYNTQQLWNDLARYPANIYPVKDAATGEWSGTSIYPNNPVASVNDLGWLSNTTRILQGNFELKEKLDDLLPGLYLSQAFSINSYTVSTYNKTTNYARYYNGGKTTTDQNTPIRATAQNPGGQEDWKQLALTLGYAHQQGNNRIVTAVNYHQSDYRGDGLFSQAYHYQNLSGRAHYTFRDRYVGEVGFSYFGSDAYAPGNRWGFYPAVSAAWIVSEEDFLKNNTTVNLLKLRASAGKTGNADADAAGSPQGQNGRFLYQQYYPLDYNSFYTGNGTPAAQGTLNPLYIANADIFAEQSMKYNVGAEVNLFKKLEISIDYFIDKRSDIITRDNSIPGSFGNIVVIKNLGKQTNQGVELTVGYTGTSGAFGYTMTGMAFYNHNRIDYMAEVPPAFAYNAQTGRAYGTRIGLVAAGFYQPDDFNPDGSLKASIPAPAFGKVQPGDLRYNDLDGDGKVDQTDITEIGKPAFPQWTYAFNAGCNYKGFDLAILLQGTAGSAVNILSNSALTQPFVNNGNAFEPARDAWAYYPAQGIDTRATARLPRLTTQGNNNNYRLSSFWMKSGDYLRIRNITIGYSFSSKWMQRVHLSKSRFYVTAVNPVTFSRLLKDYDLDPETPSGYPAMKTVCAGISLTF